MMITFKNDVAKRKRLFTPESFAHPAKMHLGMLLWIMGKYTKVGETILDPMAGAGSTMLATRYGRNVILVELEQKFVDMAGANWDKIKTLSKLKYELGTCQILQGDARQLEGLLCDSIISSPPYANAQVPPHTQEGEELRLRIAKERGVSPDKVSYMDYTKKQVDRIITSPPYAEQVQGSRHSDHQPEQRKNRLIKAGYDPKKYQLGKGRNCEVVWEYGKEGGQIGNLPYGSIDSIITSPPYEEAMGEKHHSPRADKLAEEKSNPVTYTERVDAVITSPPYTTDLKKDRAWMEKHYEGIGRNPKGHTIDQYCPPEGNDNIGNLKSISYLEAMLQVYQQYYQVLKPQGLMILVTKDFIRNKQRILLSIDTLKLCEQVGFVLEDWHQRKLTQQSFWRVIYYQKHPEVERLETEDILVMRKGQGTGMEILNEL